MQFIQSGQNRVAHIGNFFLQIVKKATHAFALEIFLLAAKIAGNDRVALKRSEFFNIGFPTIRHRPDYSISAVFAMEQRRHASRGAFEKQIEQESLHDVVRMMPQRDLGARLFNRNIIENASSEART
jgi:hypothetical protein